MAHRLSPRAVADLDAIWEYVARESGSSETANSLIEARLKGPSYDPEAAQTYCLGQAHRLLYVGAHVLANS